MSDSPGPGNYDPSYKNAKDNTPSYGFGGKHRDQVADGPGPGSYNPDIDSSPQKGYTIPGKSNSGPKSDVPGPGAYASTPTGRSGPSYSMRQKESRGLPQTSPGPGNYDPSYKSAKGSTPSYGFG